jgi:hypothetical protein
MRCGSITFDTSSFGDLSWNESLAPGVVTCQKHWNGLIRSQFVTFPHSKHNDQVDVLAYAALQIHQRRRVSLVGWTLDPGLTKAPGTFGSHFP